MPYCVRLNMYFNNVFNDIFEFEILHFGKKNSRFPGAYTGDTLRVVADVLLWIHTQIPSSTHKTRAYARTTEIFFNGVPNMTAHEDATRQLGRTPGHTYVHPKGPGLSSRKTGVFFSEVPYFKFKNVVKKRY